MVSHLCWAFTEFEPRSGAKNVKLKTIKTMIKSKIDARERALELAVSYINNKLTSKEVVNIADRFATFLIGDAELPDFQSDGDLVKAFLDIANNEIEKSRDRNNRELEELIKTLQGGNAGMAMGISGVPVLPNAE